MFVYINIVTHVLRWIHIDKWTLFQNSDPEFCKIYFVLFISFFCQGASYGGVKAVAAGWGKWVTFYHQNEMK